MCDENLLDFFLTKLKRYFFIVKLKIVKSIFTNTWKISVCFAYKLKYIWKSEKVPVNRILALRNLVLSPEQLHPLKKSEFGIILSNLI